MTARTRVDAALVARGIARSRTQAQALLRDGRVRLRGELVLKASTTVAPEDELCLDEAATGGESGWITDGWVGRGALKLEHALTVWGPSGLHVAGRRCVDVGASTGGFTQVLLAHGAAHVVALDVGHGQLDPRVAADPRVTDLPGTNIRATSTETLGGPVSVIVGDVSFISLRHVLEAVPRLLVPGGSVEDEDAAEVVLLVKPQFEVGADRLGHDGVVRSPALRQEVLTSVLGWVAQAGLSPFGLLRSPVTGGSGNVEYLLWARPCRTGMMDWGLTSEELTSLRAGLLEEETT